MFSPYFSSVAPGIITLQDLHFGMKSELRWVDGRWKFNPATLSRAPLNYTWASSFYLLPGWQWGFEHMKGVCTKPRLRSDPPTLLRQRRRCSWASRGGLVPKDMYSQDGIRRLVLGRYIHEQPKESRDSLWDWDQLLRARTAGLFLSRHRQGW